MITGNIAASMKSMFVLFSLRDNFVFVFHKLWFMNLTQLLTWIWWSRRWASLYSYICGAEVFHDLFSLSTQQFMWKFFFFVVFVSGNAKFSDFFLVARGSDLSMCCLSVRVVSMNVRDQPFQLPQMAGLATTCHLPLSRAYITNDGKWACIIK